MGDFPSIRATIALPFYFLAITFGISLIKRTKIFYLVIIIFFLEFSLYWQKYLRYNYNYSQNWQYGYQQMTEIVKENYSKYRQIYITKKYGEAHEFILFYWPWDPASFQNDPQKKWDFHADWYWVNSFDKFTFINDWEIKNLSIPKNTLLVTSPQNYPQNNAKLVNKLNFLNGQEAFDFVSYD